MDPLERCYSAPLELSQNRSYSAARVLPKLNEVRMERREAQLSFWSCPVTPLRKGLKICRKVTLKGC